MLTVMPARTGPEKITGGEEMRDDERLGALLLVLAIGWVYQMIAACKDFFPRRWPEALSVKPRWPD